MGGPSGSAAPPPWGSTRGGRPPGGSSPLLRLALLPFSAWLFSPPPEAVGAWREEGEREARWEGREREAALGISSMGGAERVGSPSAMGIHPQARRATRRREGDFLQVAVLMAALLLSPPWALLPSPAWYYGLVTGASAGADAGGTLTEAVRTARRRGDGGTPRRRRRAAFSRCASFDLSQLFLLDSTCELARAAGVGVLSDGVCERAARVILSSREPGRANSRSKSRAAGREIEVKGIRVLRSSNRHILRLPETAWRWSRAAAPALRRGASAAAPPAARPRAHAGANAPTPARRARCRRATAAPAAAPATPPALLSARLLARAAAHAQHRGGQAAPLRPQPGRERQPDGAPVRVQRLRQPPLLVELGAALACAVRLDQPRVDLRAGAAEHVGCSGGGVDAPDKLARVGELQHDAAFAPREERAPIEHDAVARSQEAQGGEGGVAGAHAAHALAARGADPDPDGR
eukprot:CAMPEP_0185399520 /NCGR_PEP_ID=MMETSP1364-20130426/90330_1 /TAXON_ID=38817 /ORGANISM="Gephyrocapsa oceanica, Strain RCC1303" /LENGTH=464 /DNA_ID=CAMNT_0028001805 /DNA_START=421 /DNA_END=1815 /DNA_ORIENTATION=-